MKSSLYLVRFPAVRWLLSLSGGLAHILSCPAAPTSKPGLEPVRVADHGAHFVLAESGNRFVPWGFNYDHDRDGRLLEDYWATDWGAVKEDFREMKELGANVVRIHLQLGRFMQTSEQPDATALARLRDVVRLAEELRLRLDVTGLGCYHKRDVPSWYDALSETNRWEVQARFWRAVAATCASSPAIFCYDLMNEPILPGRGQSPTDWLAGEFGGKHFVQRIALDLKGRTRKEVASAWIRHLVRAIRQEDADHMITVGVIPWALTFPGAKPLFHDPDVGAPLDFVAVHFYPTRNEVDKALKALAVYDVGKPLVVEEIFPLRCSLAELEQFIDRSRHRVDGWLGFYWGKTLREYRGQEKDLAAAITAQWLEFFEAKAPEMKAPHPARAEDAGEPAGQTP